MEPHIAALADTEELGLEFAVHIGHLLTADSEEKLAEAESEGKLADDTQGSSAGFVCKPAAVVADS